MPSWRIETACSGGPPRSEPISAITARILSRTCERRTSPRTSHESKAVTPRALMRAPRVTRATRSASEGESVSRNLRLDEDLRRHAPHVRAQPDPSAVARVHRGRGRSAFCITNRPRVLLIQVSKASKALPNLGGPFRWIRKTSFRSFSHRAARIESRPMLRLIRPLIAFALALSIPLQGLAAVTAGLCMGMGHHADMPAPAHEASAHDHGADHTHDQQNSGSDDSAHCAPCVACCAAAHIAPADRVCLRTFSPAAAIAVLPPGSAGFLPEQLDRPPLAL